MKFQETYCSQCGGEFGPGDHGFSACSDHGNEFKTMNQVIDRFFTQPAFHKSVMAYCDYIAATISANLKSNDSERMLSSVSRPQLDLSPEGSFRSTKKTILVEDRYGKQYKVTVEEV